MNGKKGIGIDTGGTYTDAVMYDFEAGKLLASSKALTTRQDLSIGILEAIGRLPKELLKEASFLSLSTTLATNACVEDQGGRAKLIFFGGDERVIDELGPKYGLPPSEEMIIEESYSYFDGDILAEPNWERFKERIAREAGDFDSAGIVEIYAMKNGAVIEKKAASLFRETVSLPVVCGHELFSDLDCLQRAAGTLLNARLFPVIREFIEAIKWSASREGITAKTAIVRSDGSLMSEGFAALRPVETLLSGPAASVSGGVLLSREKDCLVIDMGGTTTDIALVKNDNPVMSEDGIAVGKWKTFVKGFAVSTIGLGGDSAVHFDDAGLFLEPYRNVPLAVASSQYPEIADNLKKLAKSYTKHSLFLHEHYLLHGGLREGGIAAILEAASLREKGLSSENPRPGGGRGVSRYTEEEKRFCGLLEKGPLSLKAAAEKMGSDIYNFNPSRLLAEGVIQKAGFTPTDVMHLTGDFSAYSKDASLYAAKHIAFNLGIPVEALCAAVYDEVKRKLYFAIARTLLSSRDKRFEKKVNPKDAEYLIEQCYREAKGETENKLLSLKLTSSFPFVGLGAPIRVFLPDVARLFGTRAVIPEHYEIANALGAVAGRIRASFTAEIRPDYSPDGISGYKVFGYHKTARFRKLDEAEAFAASEAEEGAREEMRKRGGRGTLDITVEQGRHEGSSRTGPIFLGASITASASAAAAGLDEF